MGELFFPGSTGPWLASCLNNLELKEKQFFLLNRKNFSSKIKTRYQFLVFRLQKLAYVTKIERQLLIVGCLVELEKCIFSKCFSFFKRWK